MKEHYLLGYIYYYDVHERMWIVVTPNTDFIREYSKSRAVDTIKYLAEGGELYA